VLSTQDVSNIKLSDYGKEFQSKLLFLVLTDKHFFENVYDILNEDLFETSATQWITKHVKLYYNEYKKLPDISAFNAFRKKDPLLSDINKIAIKDTLIDAIRNEHANDLEWVADESTLFFKNKFFEVTLFEAVELLRENKFDEIKALVDAAASTGIDREFGHSYVTGIDERYAEGARNTIKTGWDPIDLYLDGGIGIGELGVILAMSSAGKTWVLCHLAANALLEGKKVIFYTLEDSETFISKRIDSIILKKSTSEMKYHIDDLKEKLSHLDDNLIVKEYPQLVTTTNAMVGHLNSLRLSGWCNPEGGEEDDDLLVIADYGDIFAPLKSFNSDWLNQKQIYNELKSFAQVMRIRLWTAAQSNIGAEGQRNIESTKMGGAYAKVAPCNIILSLSRSTEDKGMDVASLFLAKNKYGQDSIHFPVHNDNNKGEFRVYDQETEQGREIAKKMQVGDVEMKKRVGEKFKHLMEKKE
jgi:hypothetical protein